MGGVSAASTEAGTARAPAGEAADPAQRALQSVLAEGRHPYLKWGYFAEHQTDLQRLYEDAGYQLLWSREGRPTMQARNVVAGLAEAGLKGLRAADYDALLLKNTCEKLNASPTISPEMLASFDVGVSLSLIRYLSDLYIGRINPKRQGFDLNIEPKKCGFAGLVAAISRSNNLAGQLAAVEPKFQIYERLKQALTRYQRLAADADLRTPMVVKAVRAGDRYQDLPTLRKLLTAIGDLEAAEASGEEDFIYQGEIVEAVKRFQRRHGLTTDGVIGRQTFAQLNVPLRKRVEQIELALERIRWLPEPPDGPVIVVNIPGFELYGFELENDRERLILKMDVIVGRAVNKRQTPVFLGRMRYLVFRPYWNVPYSITKREIVPRLGRDPDYLARNGFQIVGGGKVYPVTWEKIERLRSGALRLRQKPGRNNALGLVKFIFPNSKNIYLHSTPAKALFSRSRRDFSHGCIRVQDPVALTEFVLREAAEPWTRERIEAAMNRKTPKRVNLAAEIPVYLFYTTAVVRENGQVYFYRDIYGHDTRLQRLLARGYPYPK